LPRGRRCGAAEAGAAFATPTIVHFGTTLLLSALLRVPWQSIILAAALWGLIGLGGLVYAMIVARRMRAQTVYQPEFEDRLFHVLLPLAAYAILALSSLAAPFHTREALFGVGAAALLLLSLEFKTPGTASSTMYLSTCGNEQGIRRG
jgi:ABC-type transport system involved in multi-copper enzyme maturation permease subunit